MKAIIYFVNGSTVTMENAQSFHDAVHNKSISSADIVNWSEECAVVMANVTIIKWSE